MNKPSREDISKVVLGFSEVIPYFPRSELAKALIIDAILKFVGTKEQLNWFSQFAIQNMSQWEGVPQLRALFCTKYAPADGEAPTIEIPGFTEGELEARYRAREIEENDRRLESYKKQAELAAAPEDRKLFFLPSPPQMPEPTAEDKEYAKKVATSLTSDILKATPTRTDEERQKLIDEIERTLGLK